MLSQQSIEKLCDLERKLRGKVLYVSRRPWTHMGGHVPHSQGSAVVGMYFHFDPPRRRHEDPDPAEDGVRLLAHQAYETTLKLDEAFLGTLRVRPVDNRPTGSPILQSIVLMGPPGVIWARQESRTLHQIAIAVGAVRWLHSCYALDSAKMACEHLRGIGGRTIHPSTVGPLTVNQYAQQARSTLRDIWAALHQAAVYEESLAALRTRFAEHFGQIDALFTVAADRSQPADRIKSSASAAAGMIRSIEDGISLECDRLQLLQPARAAGPLPGLVEDFDQAMARSAPLESADFYVEDLFPTPKGQPAPVRPTDSETLHQHLPILDAFEAVLVGNSMQAIGLELGMPHNSDLPRNSLDRLYRFLREVGIAKKILDADQVPKNLLTKHVREQDALWRQVVKECRPVLAAYQQTAAADSPGKIIGRAPTLSEIFHVKRATYDRPTHGELVRLIELNPNETLLQIANWEWDQTKSMPLGASRYSDLGLVYRTEGVDDMSKRTWPAVLEFKNWHLRKLGWAIPEVPADGPQTKLTTARFNQDFRL